MRTWLLAILCAAFALSAHAQYSSGIEGTVIDQAGAAVPHAAIALTNEDTQVEQSATSNAQGLVQVLHLPPGHYRVTVSASSFTTWEQEGISVEGSDMRAIYPKLIVGSTQSKIEVSASGSAVETTSGTISRTLEQQTVENAPLVGENLYASVATLAPGVTGLGGSFGGASGSGSQGTNSFNAEPGFQIIGAGQRQEANEYQVDGTSVNGNSRDGITNLTPEPDSVAQMKVSTDVFTADKGRQSGALIEVFTKPGTNKFHGDLSEFYTGSALTARTEFQARVPRYLRNDFGGSVGGPIRKDQTFFFGSLFWSKSNQGVTWIASRIQIILPPGSTGPRSTSPTWSTLRSIDLAPSPGPLLTCRRAAPLRASTLACLCCRPERATFTANLTDLSSARLTNSGTSIASRSSSFSSS